MPRSNGAPASMPPLPSPQPAQDERERGKRALIVLPLYHRASRARRPVWRPDASASATARRIARSAADEHDQPLAARHRRVEQVPLQQEVVLHEQRDHHRRVLRALALVHAHRVGELELAERVGLVAHAPPVEVDLDDRLVVLVASRARR